jgi:vacuole membrane protein 1
MCLCIACRSPGLTRNDVQTWMVYVLQRHGFWALVLLASIPNPAFDLCGMCCGTFGMALPSFLGGVLMGKGVIKPLWQCAIFTIIFHVQTRAVFVERVGGVLDLVLPPSAQAKRWLHDALAALSAPASSLGVRSSCAKCVACDL